MSHNADGEWGHTYFIRRGDAIKIGHSAVPRERIRDLQVAFPDKLKVLVIAPNTLISEADAHKRFAHLRLSGEWFRVAPELLEFIEELKCEVNAMRKKQSLNEVDPAEWEALVAVRHQLARAWPKLPKDAQPIASNIIQQIKNYRENPVGLKPLIARQVAEFERRMAAV
jgi:Meiotically up-regulated gene 113